MREMKDSGIEWIGKIPMNWGIEKIKHHFYISSGTTPKSDDPEMWDGNIIWITPADFKTEDVYVRNGHRNISNLGLESNSLSIIPAGNIIFSKRAPIGEVVINEVDLCTNQGCLSAIPFDASDVRYYRYVMSISTDEFELAASGTTFREISANSFENIVLPCPDYSVQRSIADYLDTKCSLIDSFIAKQEQIIERLKEYKKSVITEAVTKGLKPTAEMKDTGNEWLNSIPKTWECTQIRHLHAGLTDGTHGSYDRLDRGYLLLSSKNIREESIEIGENESYISEEDYKSIVANGFPRKDDVLLCCIGASIGRCVLYDRDKPEAFQRSVIMIRAGKNITSKFLMYSLRSKNSLNQEQILVNQSAQPGLYQGLVSRIYISVPSLDEQKDITSYLDDKVEKINDEIKKKIELVKKLREYKKSLIYEVVTGKKEV